MTDQGDNDNKSSGWPTWAGGILDRIPKPVQGMAAVLVLLIGVAFVFDRLGERVPLWAFLVLFAVIVALVVLIPLTMVLRVLFSRSARGVARALAERSVGLNCQLTVIGVHVGREHIECGALRLQATVRSDDVTLADRIGGAKITELSPLDRHRVDPDDFFGRTARAIVEAADAVERSGEEALPVGGIAVALPGLIELPRKTLLLSSKGMPPGTMVAERLATAILNLVGERSRRLFGVTRSDTAALARRLFLDNDARALARLYAFHHRDIGDLGCLLLSDGVGGGFLSSGQVMYGRHNSAGEVGHMTVPDTAAQLRWRAESRAGSVNLGPWLEQRSAVACACGRPGFHWEVVCNSESVLTALEIVAPNLLGSPAHVQESGRPSIEDLLALRRGPSRAEEGTSIPTRTERGQLDGALGEVAELLARPLALGIANLANLFSFEQLVVTGKVAALLGQDLQKVLSSFVGELVLYQQPSIVFDPDLDECIWKGAGYLFLDPAYSRLFPAPESARDIGVGGAPSPSLVLQETGRND